MRNGLFMMVLLVACLSCANQKSYYRTSEGKKKQKYYNSIQFGKDPHPTPPKSMTKKKKKSHR